MAIDDDMPLVCERLADAVGYRDHLGLCCFGEQGAIRQLDGATTPGSAEALHGNLMVGCMGFHSSTQRYTEEQYNRFAGFKRGRLGSNWVGDAEQPSADSQAASISEYYTAQPLPDEGEDSFGFPQPPPTEAVSGFEFVGEGTDMMSNDGYVVPDSTVMAA